MDQRYTKENIEAAMGHVRTLLDNVNALETMFPGRHFTLDGHLVGSVGEVAAAYHYGIILFPPSTELHDGYVGDRNVQIKITQTENVLIGEEPEYLIVLSCQGGKDLRGLQRARCHSMGNTGQARQARV